MAFITNLLLSSLHAFIGTNPVGFKCYCVSASSKRLSDQPSFEKQRIHKFLLRFVGLPDFRNRAAMCPNLLDGRNVLGVQREVAKKNGARYWVRTSDPHRVKQRKSSAFRVIVSQIRSRWGCMCQFQSIRGPLLSFAPDTPIRTALLSFPNPIAPPPGVWGYSELMTESPHCVRVHIWAF